jgi:hypothetical protein
VSGVRLGGRRTRNVIAPVVTLSLGEEPSSSTIERAIEAVAVKVDELIDAPGSYVADLDLVVGANVVIHGLGRKPTSVVLIPNTADATFAWAWDPVQTDNRSPERLTTVDVVGAAMRCRVLVS